MMYQIFYIHPELGKIVVSIIRGKSEAVKRLNELNKRKDYLYFIKKYDDYNFYQ